MNTSVVIPAFNEERYIGKVVQTASQYSDEVIVVDDGSHDGTVEAAQVAGARVIRQEHLGYIAAIKRGFREASCDILVTMDGDGEHYASDIPQLTKPILQNKADLVLGCRPYIARPSERLLNWLTNLRVRVRDSGTGFRALNRELALKLDLKGRCTCGILVLEATYRKARIVEVPIKLRGIKKPRRVVWYHLPQIYHVLRWLWKLMG